jgi:1-phosphofructokinase
MIFTCTLNPSIDYILSVANFKYGGLNRGTDPSYFPGGKGINVSRILTRLNVPSTALGFSGGFTGAFIEQTLREEGVDTDFVHVNDPTRINLKLKGEQETEINGPGAAITQAETDQFIDQLDQLTSDDYLVLAGSLPQDLPDDFYLQIVKRLREKSVKLVLDTSSEALKKMVGEPLFLAKPNHHELGELFDVEITSKQQAIHYAKQLHDSGITHVIISMGGDGAIYLHDNTLYQAAVPKGTVINTVGAGDSTVAGFLAGLARGYEPVDAFRLAVASGSATAFTKDLAEKKAMETLFEKVAVDVTDF